MHKKIHSTSFTELLATVRMKQMQQNFETGTEISFHCGTYKGNEAISQVCAVWDRIKLISLVEKESLFELQGNLINNFQPLITPDI